MKATPLLLTALLAAACASGPDLSPLETGDQIILALDDGRPGRAADLLEDLDDQDDRNRVYPILYDEARERYTVANYAGAVPLLRFLHRSFPGSEAAREALLYSLFLQRAQEGGANPELIEEQGALLAELGDAGEPLVWVSLIEAQQAIDRGDDASARRAFADFLGLWDGEPAELMGYVEELNRYLEGP